jgi:hypothetical protein
VSFQHLDDKIADIMLSRTALVKSVLSLQAIGHLINSTQYLSGCHNKHEEV